MLAIKVDISSLIPHAGAMCLLDGVVHWNAVKIRCFSRTHRDHNNPMRADGQLHGLCGIEYAAQAMAVHGGLVGIAGIKPRAGYLVSLREVVCLESCLDQFNDDLVVDAELLMNDESQVIYRFNLQAGEIEVLSGRATVVLDANQATT
jgi:predicted hotdog family 3-hydroxylacyl-ACP dehydratase